MADRVIEELDEAEALRLISAGGIGRIAYQSRFGPAVLPVNYRWHDGAVVGWVTSGAYAHYSRRSLAFGYVPSELAVPGAMFEVEIIGQRRPARLLPEPVLDPAGQRMRV